MILWLPEAKEGDEKKEEGDEAKENMAEDHIMIQQQKLRGMAIPSKLGANIMF